MNGTPINIFQIEQRIRLELPCVKQAMVVGDNQNYLAALLTLHTNINEKTNQPGNVLTDDAQRWFMSTRYENAVKLLQLLWSSHEINQTEIHLD